MIMKMSLCEMMAVVCLLAVGLMIGTHFVMDVEAHFNAHSVETAFWGCSDAYNSVMPVCYGEDANIVVPNLPAPYTGITSCEVQVNIMGQACCWYEAVDNHVNDEHPNHDGHVVTCTSPSTSGSE